jgi:large subunit ribosomal protein L6
MSRIGKAPIAIPQGVEINISKGNLVTVKGAKGELTQQVDPDLQLRVEDGELTIENVQLNKNVTVPCMVCTVHCCSIWVEGVSTGFVKELELVGVGYRASNTGQFLN